jgi:crotonobetainyl-CoA:carnitine CoA-transferase CaiB-like acyl-CoA transferase
MGVNSDGVVAAPFGIRRCVDGLIGINILTFQQWRQACLMAGLDDYVSSWAELSRGEGDVAGFTARLEAYLADKTVAETLELGQAFRIPVVPVVGGDEIRSVPHWKERPFFEAHLHDSHPVVHPGRPWRISGTEHPLRGGAIPRPAAETGLPFEGLRVLDLSHFWSAPYLTMYLGAFGADVLKIESIQRPDAFRLNLTSPKLGDSWYERSLFWQATNLDKRDITLDLTSESGKALFFRLLEDTDVVIENFSPRVLEQFGLGYPDLRARKSSIVLVRLPGYGLEGPWRDFVGWGDAFEQLGGFAAVTGYPDGLPQTPGGYMDPMVAMHAGAALIAALRHRDRTGEGRLIEVPQIEVAASMAAEQVIAGSLGHGPQRFGNRTPAYAPQGVYRCAGQMPEYVALTIRDDADWTNLLGIMGSPAELMRSEFGSLERRAEHHDEIDRVIGAWTRTMTPQVLTALLTKSGIPAAWLLRAVRFNDDPHLVAREFYEVMTHPLSGPRLFPRFPMRYSFEIGPHHRLPPPTLGQHNREVLCGELGLDDADFRQLEEDRCIGTRVVGE